MAVGHQTMLCTSSMWRDIDTVMLSMGGGGGNRGAAVGATGGTAAAVAAGRVARLAQGLGTSMKQDVALLAAAVSPSFSPPLPSAPPSAAAAEVGVPPASPPPPPPRPHSARVLQAVRARLEYKAVLRQVVSILEDVSNVCVCVRSAGRARVQGSAVGVWGCVYVGVE